jgi:hypothetical protein
MNWFYEAINDHGKPPPVSDRIPPSIAKAVPLDVWREYCRRGGLSSGDKPSAPRMAFNRAKDALAVKQRIGIWDDLVWVAYD